MTLLTAQQVFNFILLTLIFMLLQACTATESIGLTQTKPVWDFDHQLQYRKIQLAVNNYQLEVISNSKVNFERLSAFLLRRSYLICGAYGYKLELIKGIESFDYPRASPNLILPNLTAKLECAITK
jgi:hypothetical protein